MTRNEPAQLRVKEAIEAEVMHLTVQGVRDRVWALGGYSGTGNIVSRLCGRAAARLICGGKSEWADLLRAAHARAASSHHITVRHKA